MMHFNLLAWLQLLCLGLLCCQAAPTAGTPKNIYEGKNAIPNQYIVTMNEGTTDEVFQSTLGLVRNAMGEGDELRQTFSMMGFKAFSIETSSAVMELIGAMPGVDFYHENWIRSGTAVQHGSTYGLDRISHRENANTVGRKYQYAYFEPAGAGTYIYVLDTGINIHHVEFGGRAIKGINTAPAMGGPNEFIDYTGHGTHVASTTGGTILGVAKRATIIDVKVLNAYGKGSTESILAGLQYAANTASNTGTGPVSVLNLSLGGFDNSGGRTSESHAVNVLSNAGLFIAVAAGNDAQDSRYFAPANAQQACTVGAITSDDIQAGFSNYGPQNDLWAPGYNILGATIGSNTAVTFLNGTSMACPHVAGIGAYLKSVQSAYQNLDGGSVCAHIVSMSPRNQISFLSNNGVPSHNVIAYNGAAI